MEATVSHAVNLFVHNLFLPVLIARVIGLVLGLWFLQHHRCWALTGPPLGYPVVTLPWRSCRFGSAGPAPFCDFLSLRIVDKFFYSLHALLACQ